MKEGEEERMGRGGGERNGRRDEERGGERGRGEWEDCYQFWSKPKKIKRQYQ